MGIYKLQSPAACGGDPLFSLGHIPRRLRRKSHRWASTNCNTPPLAAGILYFCGLALFVGAALAQLRLLGSAEGQGRLGSSYRNSREALERLRGPSGGG